MSKSNVNLMNFKVQDENYIIGGGYFVSFFVSILKYLLSNFIV